VISGKRVLAVVPARGGSKGVPHKNLRRVNGRPLIAFTIEEAARSAYIDRLVLSSEDPELIAAAAALGCEAPFVRPAEYATDTAKTVDVILHAVQALPGFELVVGLQPTSPLRTREDIDGCLEWMMEHRADCCVSVSESEESPYWMFRLNESSKLVRILDVETINRRQDLPVCYSLNGAIYAAEIDWLNQTRSFVTSETLAYVMPSERSLDIDTERDLEVLAKVYLKDG